VRSLRRNEQAGRLLEIGCGIGTVATHLNANGYIVDYGDYFEDAIAIAKRRAEAALGSKTTSERRFMRVDATKPLATNEYGGILMFDVIEHLPDDELVLENVRGALEGGGRGFAFITVPAFQFLWSPWDDMEKHKRRYTKRGLVSLLEASGFEVVRSTYFFAPLFFAALGVKGLRTLRSIASPPKQADHIGDLVETKTPKFLNRIVLGAHEPERRLLRGSVLPRLPFGTSVMAIARTR
jgi:SAM-dependent methyltransferase